MDRLLAPGDPGMVGSLRVREGTSMIVQRTGWGPEFRHVECPHRGRPVDTSIRSHCRLRTAIAEYVSLTEHDLDSPSSRNLMSTDTCVCLEWE